MFRARLPAHPTLTRAYASRLPTRPPPRFKDPLETSSHAARQSLPGDLTFIYRPPPSAASPESFVTAPSSPLLKPAPSSGETSLPPVIFPKKPTPPRMSDADIAEMRRLRAQSPSRWTTGRLAAKFNCTNMFVRMMSPLPKVDRRIALAKRDAAHDKFRSKWGEKARLTKDIREKRKEFW